MKETAVAVLCHPPQGSKSASVDYSVRQPRVTNGDRCLLPVDIDYL
jgi:hypothetical protein